MSEWWASDFAKTYEEGTTQEEALAAGERLLSRPDFPHQEQLRKNITYWLPKLPGTNHDITIPVEEGWSCFNPSIAAGPDGELRAIIRTANYVMSPEGRYGGAYDTEGVIRTRNYLALSPLLGDGGRYGLVSPIEDDHLLLAAPRFPVIGFEDCRLFYHDGWKFSATVRERNSRGICQQVMCDLDGNRAENLVELSPAHDTHEKNWMPVQRVSGASNVMYFQHCYPTVTSEGVWLPAPYISRSFRGGSQAIKIDMMRLSVIHESVDFPGQSPHRVYWHRFVCFEHNRIHAISQPFCFQRRGVEFAAGMALQGDDLLISYGVGDSSAWLHRMPLQQAFEMLHSVESE